MDLDKVLEVLVRDFVDTRLSHHTGARNSHIVTPTLTMLKLPSTPNTFLSPITSGDADEDEDEDVDHLTAKPSVDLNAYSEEMSELESLMGDFLAGARTKNLKDVIHDIAGDFRSVLSERGIAQGERMSEAFFMQNFRNYCIEIKNATQWKSKRLYR